MNENLKNNNYLTPLITKLADIDKKISFLRLKLQSVEPENRESVYSFIEKHGKEYGVRWLLHEFGISASVYYNYVHRSNDNCRAQKEKILEEIRTIYEAHNGTDGYRKMHYYLTQKGYRISLETTRKYMNQELGLLSVTRPKHPPYEKMKPCCICPDLLGGCFEADRLGQKWCIDFTFIGLENGDIRYNCAIMDLFDRSIVASEYGSEMSAELAIKTLDKALISEHIASNLSLILHSDQGNEFTSKKFAEHCKAKGVRQSMSRPGHPYSNSPMERYFSTLKSELIYQKSYKSDTSLFADIDKFVNEFYNTIRPHSHNHNLPPYEWRKKFY